MIEFSEKYKKIGEQIKAELFPGLREIKIAWLESDDCKHKDGRVIFADCSKVSKRYTWCCEYDFMITVYEPNVEMFSGEQIKILLEHELHHAGEDGSIIPHDAEEFIDIIRKYGIDWQKTEQLDAFNNQIDKVEFKTDIEGW